MSTGSRPTAPLRRIKGASLAVGEVGGHLGVGVASNNSTSALARSLSPGPPPSEWGCASLVALAILWTLLMVIGFATFVTDANNAGTWVLWGATALTIFAGWTMSQSNKAQFEQQTADYQKRLHDYNNGWICVRCGQTFWPPAG